MEKEYAIQYMAIHKRGGPLVMRTEIQSATGRREAWRLLKEKLNKEFSGPFFTGYMRFEKLSICEAAEK